MRTLIEVDSAPAFAVPSGDSAGALHEGLLIEGAQGWGEFSPPPDSDAQTTAAWFTAATEAGTIGWPDMARGRIPVAVAIDVCDPQRAHDIAASSGCTAADVAIAARPDTLGADADRLAAVRAALGSGGSVRCDAGRHWGSADAIAALPVLDAAAGGLQFVADPCRTIAQAAELHRSLPVDSAVRIAVRATWATGSPADLSAAADVLVLQCAELGGVRRALRFAERSGLPCVVSGGVQSSIGLASGLALAGALPELPFACGLGLRLAGDLVSDARSLIPDAGMLPVAPMPPQPDADRLRQYRITDPARLARWQERLRLVTSS